MIKCRDTIKLQKEFVKDLVEMLVKKKVDNTNVEV